jgi:hypothetical protein
MRQEANERPGRGTFWRCRTSTSARITGAETGPTVLRSVRLPPTIREEQEKRARAGGVAVHAPVGCRTILP